ncbi:MAG: hypothetical protein M3494_04065 [Actinomycetota bacterium]|nr:hypothetical protein [Rubrobacter sp.]MDQ3507180.1 hypothetical protein [Actinomycetota bacterium]
MRRLFGGGGANHPSAPLLDEDELERIGTEEDLLKNYEEAAERNFRAMEAEQNGGIELAISLYEQSVAEDFVEAHPYERLANIHERRGENAAALEVTERFISLAKSGRLPKGSQRSADRRLPEFEARAAKYRGSKTS